MKARSTRDPPGYLRVQEAVLEIARANGLGPSAKIPSERRLAAELGLSRMTVRQGIDNLVRSGVLRRDGTSGTRVADISVIRLVDSRHALSMSQIVRNSGAGPGSRLLMFGVARADRAVADRLHIAAKSPVLRIRRLRTADEAPFCIETCGLPASLVPGLVAEDLAQDASLYELLRSRYGIHPTARDSEISVGPIGDEDADLLGLPTGLNVLIYRSVVYDADGRPIECVTSLNHPQRVVFSTSVPRITL